MRGFRRERCAGSGIAPVEASWWRVEEGVGIGFVVGGGESGTEAIVGDGGVGIGACCWFLAFPLPFVSFILIVSGSTGDDCFPRVFST